VEAVFKINSAEIVLGSTVQHAHITMWCGAGGAASYLNNIVDTIVPISILPLEFRHKEVVPGPVNDTYYCLFNIDGVSLNPDGSIEREFGNKYTAVNLPALMRPAPKIPLDLSISLRQPSITQGVFNPEIDDFLPNNSLPDKQPENNGLDLIYNRSGMIFVNVKADGFRGDFPPDSPVQIFVGLDGNILGQKQIPLSTITPGAGIDVDIPFNPNITTASGQLFVLAFMYDYLNEPSLFVNNFAFPLCQERCRPKNVKNSGAKGHRKWFVNQKVSREQPFKSIIAAVLAQS